MREILFRGKRTDNSEWVEGYLYRTHNGEYEIGFYNAETNIERMSYVVIPETIGQYTGLTDKNGKRIFEGDIVRLYGGEEYEWVARVGMKRGCLVALSKDEWDFLETNTKACEIIGNIHDNPNLLESSETDREALEGDKECITK